MTKPWHGGQYPVNRKVDRANRFGAETKFAVTWPNGTNGDAWEAVNGIFLPKTGSSDSTLATSPYGVGIDCEAGSDATRSHTYPIPAAFTYDSSFPENFVVSLYGSAQGGSFLNFIGDASGSNSTMRFRSTGDTFYMQWAAGGARTMTLTAGLTGSGSTNHLFSIVVDHTNSAIAMYVDGVLDDTSTTVDEGFDFHDFLMGINTTGYGWSGYIQEIQVFLTPTPWTAADAAAHAENFLQIYETDIVFPYLVSPSSAATAVLSGTMTATVDEDDITAGAKTIIVTLVNDTFKAAGTGPIGSTADTQALIDGFDAASSPTNGWNNEVRDKAATTEVVRTSSTVATWTVAAQAGYDVSAQETITGTIPTAVLVTGAGAITATPTFTVDAVSAGLGAGNLLLLGVG